MNGISLLVAITMREYEEDFTSFLQSKKICAIFTVLCHGTAEQSVLDILGLEKTEKVMIMAALETKKAKRVLQKMVANLGISVPGSGIALCIPVGSIGGASSMKYLLEKQNVIIGEAIPMEEKQQFFHDMIVAIVERGNTDTVMEAARSAGARGGTVINAKGAGTDFTAKFLGMSLAAEKEMVLIVVKRKDKADVMKAIMAQAGISSEAHTALFSIPIEDVVGLTSVLEEEPLDDEESEKE